MDHQKYFVPWQTRELLTLKLKGATLAFKILMVYNGVESEA